MMALVPTGRARRAREFQNADRSPYWFSGKRTRRREEVLVPVPPDAVSGQFLWRFDGQRFLAKRSVVGVTAEDELDRSSGGFDDLHARSRPRSWIHWVVFHFSFRACQATSRVRCSSSISR